MELLLDGRSLGSQPAGAEHRFRAEFETTYEPGLLEAVARRDGAEVGRTNLRSASGSVMLDVRADRKEIAADLDDLAFVEIGLVDESGTLVHRPPTDRSRSSSTVPACLQGLGSANPCTEERFTESACTTFGGRALAVVRPTGAGTINVTVVADGCDPLEVRIDAVVSPDARRQP